MFDKQFSVFIPLFHKKACLKRNIIVCIHGVNLYKWMYFSILDPEMFIMTMRRR